MKKNLSICLLSFILLSGCSENQPTQVQAIKEPSSTQASELSPDDLNVFIEDYFGLYCDTRLMMNDFWIQYYSPTYKAMIANNGDDIPVMNMIGEMMLNKTQIENFDERLENLKSNPLSSEFEESIRLLTLAYDFQQQYFKGSANLLSFEEFTSGVIQKQLAFAETIKKIQQEMIDEHAEAIDEYDNLFSVESIFIYMLEDSCNEEVWNTISKQNGLENDRSIAAAPVAETYEEEIQTVDAFISLPDISTLSRSDNNAYYIYGTTSANCSQIFVEAQNISANLYDKYELGTYQYGDTLFKYGIREDWNNLDYGSNVYTFTAYCDNNQVMQNQITLDLTNTYIPPSTNYPSYSSTYSSKSFKGYSCTDDCSGHEAGYEWAEDKDIYDYDNCSGNSTSFIEGCKAYVDELMENRDVDIYEIDDNYAYGEDEYGNDVELYITNWDEGDSYGYGEDEYGNELEFYYWD